MTVHFYSVKGGQGCTTTAAIYALRRGLAIDSHDLDDLRAVIGWCPGLNNDPLKPGDRETVMDWGTNPIPDDIDGVKVLVTRACYLALRRATVSPVRPDHVVLIAEPGRALGVRDVEHCVGAPVTTLPYDPAIARDVDAGLLSARPPKIALPDFTRQETPT